MPLPLPAKVCDQRLDLDPACCHLWVDRSQQLLDYIWSKLEPCMPPIAACVTEFTRQVTHGQPELCCDQLNVWVDAVSYSQKSANPRNNLQCIVISRIRFGVSLNESCYPTIRQDGNRIVNVQPSELAAVMPWLYSHGETLWRALLNAGSAFTDPCSGIQVNDFKPVKPSGGCAGWTGTVSVDFV